MVVFFPSTHFLEATVESMYLDFSMISPCLNGTLELPNDLASIPCTYRHFFAACRPLLTIFCIV